VDRGYKKISWATTFLLFAREYYSSAKNVRAGTPRIVVSKLQTRISWSHNLISDAGRYLSLLLKVQVGSRDHKASSTRTGCFFPCRYVTSLTMKMGTQYHLVPELRIWSPINQSTPAFVFMTQCLINCIGNLQFTEIQRQDDNQILNNDTKLKAKYGAWFPSPPCTIFRTSFFFLMFVYYTYIRTRSSTGNQRRLNVLWHSQEFIVFMFRSIFTVETNVSNRGRRFMQSILHDRYQLFFGKENVLRIFNITD